MAPSGRSSRKKKKEGCESLGITNIFSHALMSIVYEEADVEKQQAKINFNYIAIKKDLV